MPGDAKAVKIFIHWVAYMVKNSMFIKEKKIHPRSGCIRRCLNPSGLGTGKEALVENCL
jgi:hypothetical protein